MPRTTEAMLKAIRHATGWSRARALHAAVEEYALAHGIALEPPLRPTAPPAGAPPAPPRLFVQVAGRPAVEVLEDGAVLGSSRRCEVWINLPHVETRHARVALENGHWVLEDLNSEAGTFYRGRRIRRRVLRSGDEFSFAGFAAVRFEMHP